MPLVLHSVSCPLPLTPDALLCLVSAFPDRGRRNTAASFAVEVLHEAALEGERRQRAAAGRLPLSTPACPDDQPLLPRPAPQHAAFLLDAARHQGGTGGRCERAAGCTSALTRLSPHGLPSLVEVAAPRLAAAALAAGGEAAAWEEAGPLVGCASGWRLSLSSTAGSDSPAAATARLIHVIAHQLLPSLRHGAQQRPACAAVSAFAGALRVAALASPDAWFATPANRGSNAHADATGAALCAAYGLLKAWAKKPHGRQAAMGAMVAIMSAAPPQLFRSPRRGKLVDLLCEEVGSREDAVRLGGLLMVGELLRATPVQAVSALGGTLWRDEVAQLLQSSVGVSRKGGSAGGPAWSAPPRLHRQALVSLLCAAARTDAALAVDTLEVLAGSPAVALRAVGLGAAAALLSSSAAAAAGLDDAQRAKAEAALWSRCGALSAALRAALAPPTSQADDAGEDAAAAALGCLQLLLPKPAASQGSARLEASSGAEDAVALLSTLACGGSAALASASRAALRTHAHRLPAPALLKALRAAARCASRRAHGGAAPPPLLPAPPPQRPDAAGGTAWTDALALLVALLEECAQRAGAGGAAFAGTLPGGAAWGALRVRCEGCALLALAHPCPAAWPLARAVAAAAAAAPLRELEHGRGARPTGSRSAPSAAHAPGSPGHPSRPAETGRAYLADALELLAPAHETGSPSSATEAAAAAGLSPSSPPPSAATLVPCAPDLAQLLRAPPTAALAWAWRKLARCRPWTQPHGARGTAERVLWTCQHHFLLAALRIDEVRAHSAAHDVGPLVMAHSSSVDAALSSLSGSLRGGFSAAVAGELANAEASAWLRKERMCVAAAREALCGIWGAMAASAPDARDALLAACATLHASCHEVFLEEADRRPADRTLALRLLAALCADAPGAPSPPQAVRAALDAALASWVDSVGGGAAPSTAVGDAASYENACGAAAAARLRLAASGGQALSSEVRGGLVTALLASRELCCEALHGLLQAGPLDDVAATSAALRRLERALRELPPDSEQAGLAGDAVTAALTHAHWACPFVAASSFAPDAAAPHMWRALVRSVCARPGDWAAHAVVVQVPSPSGAATASSPVPVGALVAAALLQMPRASRACRQDALALLGALTRAFPPTAPADAAPLRRLPPPLAAMLNSGAASADGATAAAQSSARAVDAVQISRALAAAYPHWAPAVMSALVPLAAAACPLPQVRPSSASTVPAPLLLALAAPWAAALPRLLARLAGPGVAAATAAAAAAAAAGRAPPPLQRELTPRSLHLERFLGDSVQLLSGPPARTATDGRGGGPAGWPSQASTAVCAVSGAVLALSDLLPVHDGALAPSLAPLWGAMLAGDSPEAGLAACQEAAAAVATFLLEAHADGGEDGTAARIEGVVALLLDAPPAAALCDVWCQAVRSHEHDATEGDSPGGEGSTREGPPAGGGGGDTAAVSRARLEVLERSALRLCAAAAALPRGASLLAPHAPRLLHASLALDAPQQHANLPWLLLRAASASSAQLAARAASLLQAPQLRGGSTGWAASPQAVPLLSALATILAAWRPGLRRAWRREALGWVQRRRGGRHGALVSLRVAAALSRQQAAPQELLRLVKCMAAAGAAGDADIASAALTALPSAVGHAQVTEAHHFAAAAALAAMALPLARTLSVALPLAEALLSDVGFQELSRSGSQGAQTTPRHSAALSSTLGGRAVAPPLLAGCGALSRFWFSLPSVPCDAAAATMLLRAASLPGCTPCALRLLDALAVAQADTLPADNCLLVLALLSAAVETQVDPAGPAPRARRAVTLLDACGFALDEVAEAFRALLVTGTPTGPMCAPSAVAFSQALCAALTLACPAPSLWSFAARAAGRLASHGPRGWRAAALRLAAALLRSRARAWAPDVLAELAGTLQRAPETEEAPQSPQSPSDEATQCVDEEVALLSALVACCASASAGDAASAALAQAITAAGGPAITPGAAAAAASVDASCAACDSDAVPGASASESAQLGSYVAAWVREYVLPGLAALPCPPEGADGADDGAFFVDGGAEEWGGEGAALRGSSSVGALHLVAADVGPSRGSPGGAQAAPAPGSDWRLWAAWQGASAHTPTRPNRASRGQSGEWALPEEGAPSQELWWGGAASRLTADSSADWAGLPHSASHSSSAAMFTELQLPQQHASKLDYPAEEDEDALFQRQRFLAGRRQ